MVGELKSVFSLRYSLLYIVAVVVFVLNSCVFQESKREIHDFSKAKYEEVALVFLNEGRHNTVELKAHGNLRKRKK